VQSARFEETFSSVHEIEYYIIRLWETFVEKSVNAGHFPYSS